jgi:Trk-type K+ transport system membrane component
MNNHHKFKMNYEIHSINTRNKLSFYQPYSHLSVFHKNMEIKIYNKLPPQIKDLTTNMKQFESALLVFTVVLCVWTLSSLLLLQPMHNKFALKH